jgi:hypothetical protein
LIGSSWFAFTFWFAAFSHAPAASRAETAFVEASACGSAITLCACSAARSNCWACM